MGLAGLVLIEDEEIRKLMLPKQWGIDDVPVIIQDKQFSADGQVDYQLDIMTAAVGWFGDTLLTNGAIYPQHAAPRGWLRLRLLNGCNARSLNIAASDNRPLYVIASDGGLLAEPVKVTELPMLMGERFEVLVDVRDGKLTKGIKFAGNVDIGDPVESAKRYSEEGADEIVFYDITASAEKRGIFLDVVEQVASQVFVPLCVGGGLSHIDDMDAVLQAGAEKVSLNTAAVKNPDLISEGAARYGSQAIVVGMDVLKVPPTSTLPSGYQIYINGGRTAVELDAIAWAKKCQDLGAGEICINSIDADGTLDGYELNLNSTVFNEVTIPIIASGGAGNPQHIHDVLTKGRASAALLASIVHYGQYSIRELKEYSSQRGVPMRLTW